jgi:nucleoid DNA-binding protein
MKAFTKKDIAKELASRTGHTGPEAKIIVDCVFDIIAQALESGKTVKLDELEEYKAKIDAMEGK